MLVVDRPRATKDTIVAIEILASQRAHSKHTHSKMLEYMAFLVATRSWRKASRAPKKAETQPSTNEPAKPRGAMMPAQRKAMMIRCRSV